VLDGPGQARKLLGERGETIMDRRAFLAAPTLALAGLPAAAAAQAQRPSLPSLAGENALDLTSAAGEAFLYGLMLIENAGARTTALAAPGAAANQLIHARTLTTPATQRVTTPNNDTLYSRAWIDLSAGPVTLDMPGMGKRYVSHAFMDMYGTNFAVLGTRTTGGEAARVTLVGPNHETADPLALRSPTRWVWLLTRILIDGEADRAAANRLQDAMRLTGPAVAKPRAYPGRNAPWAEYFTGVQQLLIENPPPISDLAFFRRVSALGLGPTGGFDPTRFSSAQGAQIAAGMARALAASRRPGAVRNGWTYPRANLGFFKQDYAYRANVALSGLAALTTDEAVYCRPAGMAADRPQVLRFEKDQLPAVDSFWSLTAYERTPQGQFFFFDNPLGRYAIGDRTPGLRYGADGSLEILIQRDDPGGARSANWLPAPRTAPLELVMRMYIPKPSVMDGDYSLPALRAA